MPEGRGWGPPPRRRPPWWPANEAWPPVGPDGQTRWHSRRTGARPALGCIFVAFVILAVFGAANVVFHVFSLVAGVAGIGMPSGPVFARSTSFSAEAGRGAAAGSAGTPL